MTRSGKIDTPVPDLTWIGVVLTHDGFTDHLGNYFSLDEDFGVELQLDAESLETMELVKGGEINIAPVAITPEGLWVVLPPGSTLNAAICSTVNLDHLGLKENTPKEVPTREGPTKEDLTKEGPTKEGPTEEDLTKEGPTEEGPTEEDLTKEGPTEEGPTEEDLTKKGSTKEGPSEEGPTEEGPTEVTEDDMASILGSTQFLSKYMDWVVDQHSSSIAVRIVETETDVKYNEMEAICHYYGYSPALLLTEEKNIQVKRDPVIFTG